MPQSVQIPLRITIEVEPSDADHEIEAPPSDGIKVRENAHGAWLEVPNKTRDLLIKFGWMPPVDLDGE